MGLILAPGSPVCRGSNDTACAARQKHPPPPPPRCTYLCQEDDALAIGPDDMVHLRTHALPCQLRSAQAGLKEDGTVDCGYNGREGKKALQSINERNLTTSISVLEWPMLQTIQLFFMRSKCSRVTTFLFPKGKGE